MNETSQGLRGETLNEYPAARSATSAILAEGGSVLFAVEATVALILHDQNLTLPTGVNLSRLFTESGGPAKYGLQAEHS